MKINDKKEIEFVRKEIKLAESIILEIELNAFTNNQQKEEFVHRWNERKRLLINILERLQKT